MTSFVVLPLLLCFCSWVLLCHGNNDMERSGLSDKDLDEMIDRFELMCKNTETEIGRMHLSRCVVQHSPKHFLIMMEYCKKKVFGHVKFDAIWESFCEPFAKNEQYIDCLYEYASSKKKTSFEELMAKPSTLKFIKLAYKCMAMDPNKDY